MLGLLRAENGYTQARTARLAPFRDALYAEMLSHVEEDDDTHPSPAADGVDGPFIKLKRRDPALTCSSSMDASTTCFETLSYVDGEGMSSDPGGAVFDMYHATYHDYLEDATVGVKVYLVVKDGEARWGWWDKDAQKWMMTWAELPDDYAGGKVGFTTYADQYLVEDVYVTDLDAAEDLVMCNGHGACVDGACECAHTLGLNHPTQNQDSVDCGSRPRGRDESIEIDGIPDVPHAFPKTGPGMNKPISLSPGVADDGVGPSIEREAHASLHTNPAGGIGASFAHHDRSIDVVQLA